MSPSDQKNAGIIEAVRDAFEPVLERLTPEIEPATVFVLSSNEGETGE